MSENKPRIIRSIIIVLSVVLAAGCVSYPELATRPFVDRGIAAELRLTPLPQIDVSYDIRFDPDNPVGTVLSIGTNIAKAGHAEKAEERMLKALRGMDVPEIIRRETLAGVAFILRSNPVESSKNADYLLDIDIREYGMSAGSAGGVSFEVDVEIDLLDLSAGDAVWHDRTYINEPVSPELFGVNDIVGNVVSVGVLAELSESDIVRGFESLGREAARRITRELESDLRMAQDLNR